MAINEEAHNYTLHVQNHNGKIFDTLIVEKYKGRDVGYYCKDGKITIEYVSTNLNGKKSLICYVREKNDELIEKDILTKVNDTLIKVSKNFIKNNEVIKSLVFVFYLRNNCDFLFEKGILSYDFFNNCSSYMSHNDDSENELSSCTKTWEWSYLNGMYSINTLKVKEIDSVFVFNNTTGKKELLELQFHIFSYDMNNHLYQQMSFNSSFNDTIFVKSIKNNFDNFIFYTSEDKKNKILSFEYFSKNKLYDSILQYNLINEAGNKKIFHKLIRQRKIDAASGNVIEERINQNKYWIKDSIDQSLFDKITKYWIRNPNKGEAQKKLIRMDEILKKYKKKY